MRALAAIVIFILSAAPALAQGSAAAYARAQAAYERLAPDDRIGFKILLTGAGYWVVVPTPDFSPKLFDAVARFQVDHGLAPTGVVDAALVEAVETSAAPLWRLWGFRALAHPQRGRRIWIPMGLGLVARDDAYGAAWSDPAGRLEILYEYFPKATVGVGFEASLASLLSKGGVIHYKARKPDFFAISASVGALDKYSRCQQDGAGLLCFFLTWRTEEKALHIERVAMLMSGSLAAAMGDAPFAAIPQPAEPAPRAEIVVARPPQAKPAEPAPPEAKPHGASSGSGFFVNADGYVLTNAHVVEDCGRLRVFRQKEAGQDAAVVARDERNDLAALRTSLKPERFAALRGKIRLGEGVAVFGFPLSTLLASSGNFTLGNVTALAGVVDDSRYLQISAPVQPGNSGGPLLDQAGNVVGVVSSKLDALKVAVSIGDLPQNVAFAIKATVAQSFLQSAGVDYAEGTASEAMAPPDLADAAKAMAVFILCE
ncbi:trypsin-like peptidase domain-containing protein [Methylocella sp.]|uniref:trypsin-like peptidase domain-containing protein n=1 Tax=Methylocella sp. TaxID=1978226 RepID=UPI0037831489